MRVPQTLSWLLPSRWGAARPTVEKRAATPLPDLAEPKVPKVQQTAPSSVRRSGQRGTQKLQENDRRTATTDLLTLRAGQTTKEVIRNLSATTPDLSAAVNAYIRTVVTPSFTAIARNQDGTANPEATNAVQQLVTRFNNLQDYGPGYSEIRSIHGVAEALTKELRLYGSCSLELVLDKARLPYKLQPVSTTQIVWEDDGSSTYPVQKTAGGQETILDVPTFFYEDLDPDLLEAYSVSPMEPAVQAVLQSTEFTNDLRRVIKRALHPRLNAEIDFEAFRKSIPLDVASDPEKFSAYQAQFLANIQEQLNNLEPDDALVSYDLVKFEYLSRGNESLEREYETLEGISNGKTASGAKVPGAVLGHGAGSQNIASSETMLFLQYATGTQLHVNAILSRALTLGARLMGHDVYVDFKFSKPDLRPESELAAFRAMDQSRVLELLSLGLLTDEEASIQLTGKLPPPGAARLSGTGFKNGGTAINSNPFSSTGSMGTTQDTSGQRQQPETPTQPKGPANKRADVVPLRANA